MCNYKALVSLWVLVHPCFSLYYVVKQKTLSTHDPHFLYYGQKGSKELNGKLVE